MTYERFEDLPVWRAAQDLAVAVFAVVGRPCLTGKGDLRNQLERSSLSISNNVAEGFERGSTNELIAYLYVARGSAGETRSGLCFAERLASDGQLRGSVSDISELRSTIAGVIPVCESVSRQLRGWADHLQDSDIKGPRHLNGTSRQQYEQAKRADAVREKPRRVVDEKRGQVRRETSEI